MNRLFKVLLLTSLVLILLALGLPACDGQPDIVKPDVVEVIGGVVEDINIMKASPPGYPPPPGGWALQLTGPQPPGIQEVFNPGDKMNLGLVISSTLKSEVTFSKFTFFNIGTGAGLEVETSPDALGPFKPGGKYLLGPWDIPGKDGEYELRVYRGDEVVALALFNVGL